MLDMPPGTLDDEGLETAVREERVRVSMDLDFGEMVPRRRLRHRGVLILGMDDATGAQKAAAVDAMVAVAGQRLRDRLSVYHPGRLRIGPAPIGA